MSRHLGFLRDWNPQRKTRALLDQVKDVIAEYETFGPLTIRQIFYRLVATCDFPKTEQGYERLVSLLGNARRAEVIPFSAIRDDGNAEAGGGGYWSLQGFIGSLSSKVDCFRLARDSGQPFRVIVQCESAGMVPMVADMVAPFGARVRSASGFDSITFKHDLARELADWHIFRHGVILHIGDYDPSGEHIFSSLKADVLAFLADMIDGDPAKLVTINRIGITPDQIRILNLITAPAKAKDNRAFNGVDGDPTATVQAESLSPDILAAIVTQAVRRYWDDSLGDSLDKRQAAERAQLKSWWASCPFLTLEESDNGND